MFTVFDISGFAKPDLSDLFLPGPSCTEDCTGHTTYDPSSSTTAVDLGKTADIKYGDNSTVSVEQYTDIVIVAGLTVSTFLIFDITVFDN